MVKSNNAFVNENAINDLNKSDEGHQIEFELNVK